MGIIMTDQRERAIGDALDARQCAVTEYYLAMDDEDETRIAEAEKWLLRAAKAEAMLALLTDLYKFGYTLTTPTMAASYILTSRDRANHELGHRTAIRFHRLAPRPLRRDQPQEPNGSLRHILASGQRGSW